MTDKDQFEHVDDEPTGMEMLSEASDRLEIVGEYIFDIFHSFNYQKIINYSDPKLKIMELCTCIESVEHAITALDIELVKAEKESKNNG